MIVSVAITGTRQRFPSWGSTRRVVVCSRLGFDSGSQMTEPQPTCWIRIFQGITELRDLGSGFHVGFNHPISGSVGITSPTITTPAQPSKPGNPVALKSAIALGKEVRKQPEKTKADAACQMFELVSGEPREIVAQRSSTAPASGRAAPKGKQS